MVVGRLSSLPERFIRVIPTSFGIDVQDKPEWSSSSLHFSAYLDLSNQNAEANRLQSFSMLFFLHGDYKVNSIFAPAHFPRPLLQLA